MKKLEIPEYQWRFIEECWTRGPEFRPTFQHLLDAFHGTHHFILPGADRAAVLAYETQVGTSFGEPNSRNLIMNAPQSIDHTLITLFHKIGHV
jgi:hypothetical protein